jgi:hypothetical protein
MTRAVLFAVAAVVLACISLFATVLTTNSGVLVASRVEHRLYARSTLHCTYLTGRGLARRWFWTSEYEVCPRLVSLGPQ